mmetsp:Transcript_16751/g.51709  ORF Transcript_16751/g.51709 Transcript_16751/m.51709 type:complete len:117 (+) Transcript_16751:64-414(+)
MGICSSALNKDARDLIDEDDDVKKKLDTKLDGQNAILADETFVKSLDKLITAYETVVSGIDAALKTAPEPVSGSGGAAPAAEGEVAKAGSGAPAAAEGEVVGGDRKSTRLNSSHRT